MIKPLKLRVRKSGQSGLLHNSKQDVATLMNVCNQLIEKVNELTDEVNRLSEKVNELTDEVNRLSEKQK